MTASARLQSMGEEFIIYSSHTLRIVCRLRVRSNSVFVFLFNISLRAEELF